MKICSPDYVLFTFTWERRVDILIISAWCGPWFYCVEELVGCYFNFL